MGTIMHGEHPDICAKLAEKNGLCEKSERDLMPEMNCRFYNQYIKLTSIKKSTPFMPAKSETEVIAQIHRLHRAKDLFKTNNYKPFGHASITYTYKLSK